MKKCRKIIAKVLIWIAWCLFATQGVLAIYAVYAYATKKYNPLISIASIACGAVWIWLLTIADSIEGNGCE